MNAAPNGKSAELFKKVMIPVEWYSMAVRPATKSGGVDAHVLCGGPTFSPCISSTQNSSASTASGELNLISRPWKSMSCPPDWRTKASKSQSFQPPEIVTPQRETSVPERTVSRWA
jgi:hypothetical protein